VAFRTALKRASSEDAGDLTSAVGGMVFSLW
jgi:hypothetical protein